MTTSSSRPVAYISGASRGIGRSIACKFAARGYDLALSCHFNTEKLEELADNLRKEGVRIQTYKVDISDPDEVRDMAERIRQDFGRMDVVVNNAGISEVGLVTDMTDEAWRRIVDVNLSSVFYTCRAFIPLMLKEHRGHIINISSIWGSTGASCEVAYSATKSGVEGFTRALAKELAPSGISVNAIAPGVIDTDMNSHLSAPEKAELAEEIPTGRFGTPEEVAAAVYVLCTMPYTTGQIIGVNGGWF